MIEQLIATIESVIPDPQVDTPYVDPQVVAQAVMGLLAEQPGVNIERSMRISNILDSTGQSTWQVGWSGTPGDDRMVEPGRYALVRLED